MKKIITFSYEGIEVPFEIRDRYWMVDLSNIEQKFNKEVGSLKSHPLTEKRLSVAYKLSNHPMVSIKKDDTSGKEKKWYHYLAASYAAPFFSNEFDIWLLWRYLEVLNEFSVSNHLYIEESEQLMVHLLSEARDQDDINPFKEIVENEKRAMEYIPDKYTEYAESILGPPPFTSDLFFISRVAAHMGKSNIQLLLFMIDKNMVGRKDGLWTYKQGFYNEFMLMINSMNQRLKPVGEA